jgi:hypothetical protein
VPEKENIKQHSENEGKGAKNPNDESEDHTTKNDGLLVVLACKDFNLLEEI